MELFKLESNLNLTNMHAFNAIGVIEEYESPEAIINEYFPIRYQAYTLRKLYLIRKLLVDTLISQNKSRFIQEIISGQLTILKQSKSPKPNENAQDNSTLKEYDLIQELEDKNYMKMKDIQKILYHGDPAYPESLTSTPNPQIKIDAVTSDISESNEGSTGKAAYQYLLDMPIYSLTYEKFQSLQMQTVTLQSSLVELRSKSEKDLWLSDLDIALKKATELGLC